MLNINYGQKIALRRNQFIVKMNPVQDEQSFKVSRQEVAILNLNLQSLGYVLSNNLIFALCQESPARLRNIYNELVDILKEIRGVKTMRPMYPNYPQQVADASEAELYLNAVLHYFSAFISDITDNEVKVWLPKYEVKKRNVLDEKVELTMIDLADDDFLSDVATRIVMSNTSITEQQKEELTWLISKDYLVLPETIPYKENLVIVGSVLFGKKDIRSWFKTATDVLRLAVALSGGDVSLATNTKFRNFTRPERRAFMELLRNCGSSLQEDMQRFQGMWIRLGEKLHPGEYASSYPVIAKAFRNLRNDKLIQTFNSKVENAIRTGDVYKAVELLSTRPGEFARRLYALLNKCQTNTQCIHVINAFRNVSSEISTPVLLQVKSHFENHMYGGPSNDLRVIFPKGNISKVQVLPVQVPNLAVICNAQEIVIICENVLVTKFLDLPPLGKVYIDPMLKGVLLPFSQRSASKSVKSLVRGSKIPFDSDEKQTVRFFIWWKENGSRCDLDLSAKLYSEDWKFMQDIAYYSLSGRDGLKGYHSGDITSAPDGACEFIDLEMPSLIKSGGRYVVMTVNSYTHQAIKDLAECRAGMMLREKPDSGEVFEPSTILNAIDVTADSQAFIPMVIDVVERKMIWMDIVYKTNQYSYNNANSNGDIITLMGKAFTSIIKPDVYSLLYLHTVARGLISVDSPDVADIVFGPEMAYETEKIAAEYMI